MSILSKIFEHTALLYIAATIMAGNTSKQTTPMSSPKSAAATVQAPGSASITSGGLGDDELKNFLAGITEATDDQKKLLKELYILNGQDAYDAEAAAVGRLKQEEYLAIPEDFVVPDIKPSEVGKSDTRRHFKARDLADIYTLNKKRAPVGENAIVYAMIRMEAVKMGWVKGQKEIIRVARPSHKEAIEEFANDLGTVRTQLDMLRLAAFLVPLVCEHTFRTMGHHYITGLATEYQSRYRKTLKSCLAEDIMSMLQPATMFHHVLHWVSPERAYNVLHAQLSSATLPDALVIRANAPPAGWAVITTTAAVLKALESANLFSKVDESTEIPLDSIDEAAERIKTDVRKWHKAYFAYGVAPPSAAEMKEMEEQRDNAIAFAPYAQGFIDGTLRDAALGQAQALKKHAELNPIARAKAARFFRAVARTSVEKVEDLFTIQLKSSPTAYDD